MGESKINFTHQSYLQGEGKEWVHVCLKPTSSVEMTDSPTQNLPSITLSIHYILLSCVCSVYNLSL